MKKFFLLLALTTSLVACKTNDSNLFSAKSDFFDKKLRETVHFSREPVKASIEQLKSEKIVHFATSEDAYKYYLKLYSSKADTVKKVLKIADPGHKEPTIGTNKATYLFQSFEDLMSKHTISLLGLEASAKHQAEDLNGPYSWGYQTVWYGGDYLNITCGTFFVTNYNVSPEILYLWRLDQASHDRVYEQYGLTDTHIANPTYGHTGLGTLNPIGSATIRYESLEQYVEESTTVNGQYVTVLHKITTGHTVTVWLPTTQEPPSSITLWSWGNAQLAVLQ